MEKIVDKDFEAIYGGFKEDIQEFSVKPKRFFKKTMSLAQEKKMEMEKKKEKEREQNFSVLYAFAGKLNREGKRVKMCHKLLEIVGKLKREPDLKKKPVEEIMECAKKIMPLLRLKSKRVGGVIYKLPIPLRKDQEMSKGLRWFANSNKQKKKSLVLSVVEDIILSKKDMGEVVKRKENDYKVAIANRPFVKYLKKLK